MPCLKCASLKARNEIDEPVDVDVIAYANGEIQINVWNEKDEMPIRCSEIRFSPKDWLSLVAKSVDMTNTELYKEELTEALNAENI